MDKFLGLQPAPSKKLKDTKASNKRYDLKKRERSFQACWSSQFEWLLHSSVKKKSIADLVVLSMAHLL